MENQQTKRHPVLLISDLDDTIKISNTQSRLITVYRGLFRDSAFAGMAQLYSEILATTPISEFHLVTSSPPQIRNKVRAFLRKNNFPKAQIIFRDWIRQTSILDYKINSLNDLVKKTDLPILLIGDDTEHDPEVFAEIAKRFPEKMITRYIRMVRGRELPPGTKGFFTAFDIACAELTAGRFNSEQVLRIGEALLVAEKPSRLIPWFSLKPPMSFVPFVSQMDDTIVDLWNRIQEKLQAIPRRKEKK